MQDEQDKCAADWRARMAEAIDQLNLDTAGERHGERMGDAAAALAELESVRTICAWAERYAAEMTSTIEHVQRREIRTMEAMLISLGSKELDREPISEMDRIRFIADLLGRLAELRGKAVQTGMEFAVSLLAETRAYFGQIATGRENTLSVLVHACMVGEMKKMVDEDGDETPDQDARPACMEAILDELSRSVSEVKS